jgi:hypothetical protein
MTMTRPRKPLNCKRKAEDLDEEKIPYNYGIKDDCHFVLPGAGHSPFSPLYGLTADNILCVSSIFSFSPTLLK